MVKMMVLGRPGGHKWYTNLGHGLLAEQPGQWREGCLLAEPRQRAADQGIICDEFCIQNDEFCIKNDEFALMMMNC